jgi:hypothetical protein
MWKEGCIWGEGWAYVGAVCVWIGGYLLEGQGSKPLFFMMFCLIMSKDNSMHVPPYVVYVPLAQNLCFREQLYNSMDVMFQAHGV